MSIPCPNDLGSYSTFHRTFVDFENKDEIIAYACLLYTVSKVIKTQNITPELKKYISISLDKLESWKKEFNQTSYNEIIANEDILSNHISNQANKMFAWAEKNDSSENYTIDVVQTYYMVSILFIVSQHFSDDENNKEDELKRKFCMQRSLHLKKCIKSGKPPADYQTFCNAFYGSFGISNPVEIQSTSRQPEITLSSILSHNNLTDSENKIQTPTPTQIYENLDLNKNNDSNSFISSNTSFNNNMNKSVNNKNWEDDLIDYDTNQLAQKNLKHAISALSYDDVDTAIDLINKSLNLIKPFSKKLFL